MLNKKNWYIISALLIIFGGIGAVNILINGEAVLGTNQQVPWGMLIAGYVFFALSSAGVGLVGSLGDVFGIAKFEPIKKRSTVLSTILLLCGFGILALELGNPFRLIYIMLSPNITAPIWWMGFFYSIYLLLLLAELYFTHRKNPGIVKGIANVSLVVKLAAVSNLGAVFGMIHARPFWGGAFFPIFMIISAVLSGAAILAIISCLVGKHEGKGKHNGSDITGTLGRILACAVAITFIGTVWKVLTGLFGGFPGHYEAAAALLRGPLSISFWMEMIVGLLIPFAILLSGSFRLARVFGASILAICGVFIATLNFVIAGQISPKHMMVQVSQIGYAKYVPTWSEWSLILGAMGVAIIVYLFVEQKNILDIKKKDFDLQS